jgi:hypothetical protein
LDWIGLYWPGETDTVVTARSPTPLLGGVQRNRRRRQGPCLWLEAIVPYGNYGATQFTNQMSDGLEPGVGQPRCPAKKKAAKKSFLFLERHTGRHTT